MHTGVDRVPSSSAYPSFPIGSRWPEPDLKDPKSLGLGGLPHRGIQYDRCGGFARFAPRHPTAPTLAPRYLLLIDISLVAKGLNQPRRGRPPEPYMAPAGSTVKLIHIPAVACPGT